MLARTPRNRPAVPERPRQLRSDRRAALRGKIAAIMARAEPTPFAAEGPCRAGIRSALCLQGWQWSVADVIAHEVVASALRAVGAVRPTWLAGQPEYTQPGVHPMRFTCCQNCGRVLPEDHFRFCCKSCATNHSRREAYRRMSEEQELAHRARKAAYRASRKGSKG